MPMLMLVLMLMRMPEPFGAYVGAPARVSSACLALACPARRAGRDRARPAIG